MKANKRLHGSATRLSTISATRAKRQWPHRKTRCFSGTEGVSTTAPKPLFLRHKIGTTIGPLTPLLIARKDGRNEAQYCLPLDCFVVGRPQRVLTHTNCLATSVTSWALDVVGTSNAWACLSSVITQAGDGIQAVMSLLFNTSALTGWKMATA